MEAQNAVFRKAKFPLQQGKIVKGRESREIEEMGIKKYLARKRREEKRVINGGLRWERKEGETGGGIYMRRDRVDKKNKGEYLSIHFQVS
ncbi:hypothetical protein SLEP1_g33170 [Rubroshorea leprosula]|uniref:Uncharacterized protein n=1 Tax=Rubroshorea leprosula TaxID=152421 RepID=A0AAV5KFT5_9ROSI|nr:hypothetical protein SLEP1_g33170 [Rubroshorea leprosula]